jgi:hypothetical protein
MNGPQTLQSILAALGAALGSTALFADDRIAFSIVHAQDRIDVPLSQVTSVEATPDPFMQSIDKDTKNIIVSVCYSKHVQAQICALTTKLVGVAVDMQAGCETVSRPVIRQPICQTGCILMSAADQVEAESVAGKIKAGLPCRK